MSKFSGRFTLAQRQVLLNRVRRPPIWWPTRLALNGMVYDTPVLGSPPYALAFLICCVRWIASVLRDASSRAREQLTNLAPRGAAQVVNTLRKNSSAYLQCFCTEILQKHALKQSREQKW